MNRTVSAMPALLCTAYVFLLGASTAGADFVQTENMTMKTGDTPRLRFEQTGGGFTAQTWDIGANESNFFVRDFTGGSLLPLRIRPGAPTSSIDIAAGGNVGLGTSSPSAPLQIARDGAVSTLYTDVGPAPDVSWATGIPAGGGSFTIGLDGTEPVFELLPDGDLALAGSLLQAAGQGSVADRQNVDAAAILDRLGKLPIQSWRFAGAPAGDRHLGPLAQDFSAAFGLGENPGLISPADAAGVSLVAIQALIAKNRALESKLGGAEAAATALSKRVAELRPLQKRVGTLAKQMKKLRKAVRKLAG
jgi:endosialidase-like protein